MLDLQEWTSLSENHPRTQRTEGEMEKVITLLVFTWVIVLILAAWVYALMNAHLALTDLVRHLGEEISTLNNLIVAMPPPLKPERRGGDARTN